MESIKNGITFLINSLGRTRFQRYLRSLIRPETAPREKKASKNPVKKLLYSFFFFFEFTIPYNINGTSFIRGIGIAD